MAKSWRMFLVLLVFFLSVGLGAVPPAAAQSENAAKPIDMMLLIDNSCSMFPADKIPAGCDAYGSDPNFLRIVGADLFIARLGFSEPNAADYRLGVVSIGKAAVLVSPLISLGSNRDNLANLVANPQPQTATQIVGSLQMAYDALKGSQQAAPARLPALVMITDGAPWPPEGQSNADIENLVTAHPGIPLFVMLLKNNSLNSAAFDSYVSFWQSLQNKYPATIFSYLINDASQIQDTYNKILGQIQTTIPAKGVQLDRNAKTTFTVGTYIKKIIITSIRKSSTTAAKITITDPAGNPVAPTDNGVSYFRGKDNPVEIYAIAQPRLAAGDPGGTWSISTTDPVTIMVDRIGGYKFDFMSLPLKSVGIGASYEVTSKQFTDRELTIRFRLVDEQQNPIIEHQPISVSVADASGKSVDLPLSSLTPDTDGIYQFPVDLGSLFAAGNSSSGGQYSFSFSAGQSDLLTKNSPPIARAAVSLQVGMIPSIRSMTPAPVYCRTGEPAALQVELKDIDPDLQSLLFVHVIRGNQTISLTASGPGQYSGDVSAICQALVQQMTCSSLSTANLTVAVGVNSDAITLPEISRQMDANVVAPTCTGTPPPTGTPRPTPTPAPLPDSDHDGVPDQSDKCPTQWGLPITQGCFPWNGVLGAGGAIVFLGMLRLWVWPWAMVTRISPAPKAYLVAYRDGVKVSEPVAIDQLSRKKHATRLVIGGRRGADVTVPDLRPVEYLVEWNSGIASLRDPQDKEPFAYFDAVPRTVHTSDPKVILRIGILPQDLYFT